MQQPGERVSASTHPPLHWPSPLPRSFLAAFYREAVRRMNLEARFAEMERSGVCLCVFRACVRCRLFLSFLMNLDARVAEMSAQVSVWVVSDARVAVVWWWWWRSLSLRDEQGS